MTALAVRAHMRQETSDAINHTHQIDVDDPSPVVERDAVDPTAGRDAGVVADNVNAAESVERCLRCLLNAIGIRDIAADTLYSVSSIAQKLDGPIKRDSLNVREHHVHAGFSKGAAQRKADPRRAASYECRLALEFAHSSLPNRRFSQDSSTARLHDGAGMDSGLTMTLAPTVVFDLDGTLVDTAPDLIEALNFVLDREGLPPVPLRSARSLIGTGARKLIERGLESEGRVMTVKD